MAKTKQTRRLPKAVEKIKEEEESPRNSRITTHYRRLPLFNGPRVKLRLVPSEKEYEVSVTILSKYSCYFAKMFQEDRFIEGQEKEAILEEMDGVVSTRSIEHLLEWMYMEKFSFISRNSSDSLSEALEFLRLADMCDVHGMEQPIASLVQDLITKIVPGHWDIPEFTILPEQIKEAGLLPKGHPARPIIVKRLAKSFLNSQEEFPYFDEISRSPCLSTEILKEVRPLCLNRNGYTC